MKSNRESPRLPFVAAVHRPVAVTVNSFGRLNLSLKRRFWRSVCGTTSGRDSGALMRDNSWSGLIRGLGAFPIDG
jgi:hypothetical protein